MITKIKEYCTKRGLSISDIEKALGFSNSAIYRWDNNSPSIEKVKKVADYLGVTVNDLLDYPPEESLTLSPEEGALLAAFRDLNSDGQQKILDYIADIKPRYIKNNNHGAMEKEA